MSCADENPARGVVLVSKDINMRIKARALGLAAEDYYNDKALDDFDLLYTGCRELPADFWDTTEGHGALAEGRPHLLPHRRPAGAAGWHPNQFVYLDETGSSCRCTRRSRRSPARRGAADARRLHATSKNAVWGITARNREQNFALNLLMDPDVDFVTLLGQAGTGKTLLALAAGLARRWTSKRYSRDHHDPRHGAGRRGHRLPARAPRKKR